MTYTLRRSQRAKNLRLSVRPGGAIVLTAPKSAQLEEIEQFAARYAAWALRASEAMRDFEIIPISRKDIAKLKAESHVIATSKVRHFASLYGVQPGSITIGAHKRRWGSCSHRGNLTFNYRLAALPLECIEYIIVHEVCHLVELNHSKRFWALVGRQCASYKEVRRRLRRIAFTFH